MQVVRQLKAASCRPPTPIAPVAIEVEHSHSISVLCGDAYALERAADPLHRPRIDTEPLGYLTHALGTPGRFQEPHGFALPAPAQSAAGRVACLQPWPAGDRRAPVLE